MVRLKLLKKSMHDVTQHMREQNLSRMDESPDAGGKLGLAMSVLRQLVTRGTARWEHIPLALPQVRSEVSLERWRSEPCLVLQHLRDEIVRLGRQEV